MGADHAKWGGHGPRFLHYIWICPHLERHLPHSGEKIRSSSTQYFFLNFSSTISNMAARLLYDLGKCSSHEVVRYRYARQGIRDSRSYHIEAAACRLVISVQQTCEPLCNVAQAYTQAERLCQNILDTAYAGLTKLDQFISLTKIAPEISGSFACFLMLIVMARMSRYRVRLTLLATVGFWAAYNDNWIVFLFLFGMTFADYDAEMTLDGMNGLNGFFAKHDRAQILWNTTWSLALLLGVYLSELNLSFFGAMGDIWKLCFAATLILSAIYHLPKVRSIFDTFPMQELGRLSFGIYLCHLPVMEEIVVHIRPLIVNLCAKNRLLMVLMLLSIEVSLTLVFAQCFERLIDRPCIQFSRWLESLAIDTESHVEMVCVLPR